MGKWNLLRNWTDLPEFTCLASSEAKIQNSGLLNAKASPPLLLYRYFQDGLLSIPHKDESCGMREIKPLFFRRLRWVTSQHCMWFPKQNQEWSLCDRARIKSDRSQMWPPNQKDERWSYAVVTYLVADDSAFFNTVGVMGRILCSCVSCALFPFRVWNTVGLALVGCFRETPKQACL